MLDKDQLYKEYRKEFADHVVAADFYAIEAFFLSKIPEILNDLVGENKSVEELLELMGESYRDLPVQVSYKEGFNRRNKELQDKVKKLGYELQR